MQSLQHHHWGYCALWDPSEGNQRQPLHLVCHHFSSKKEEKYLAYSIGSAAFWTVAPVACNILWPSDGNCTSKCCCCYDICTWNVSQTSSQKKMWTCEFSPHCEQWSCVCVCVCGVCLCMCWCDNSYYTWSQNFCLRSGVTQLQGKWNFSAQV